MQPYIVSMDNYSTICGVERYKNSAICCPEYDILANLLRLSSGKKVSGLLVRQPILGSLRASEVIGVHILKGNIKGPDTFSQSEIYSPFFSTTHWLFTI